MARSIAPLAKITAPRLRAIHRSERLFEQLDRAFERPVVWIHGPPGAGKTTLIASYLKSRRRHSLWYRLDEGDADPATFFYFLGLAAKQAATRDKRPLPLLTPEYRRGLPAFTRLYFQGLYEHLPQRSIIVFDDYHEVALSSAVHDVIPHGLSETPDSGHVIILSRREPPPQLARLRANDRLHVVPPDVLRLNFEEVRGVALSRGRSETNLDLTRLAETTQGWVAGVILMLESGKAPPGKDKNLDDGSPQLVFDYFAEEVFRSLDETSREALLITAFPPAITGRMAEQLTENFHTRELLEELVRKNYFTFRDTHDQPAYRYHPLFREFLLAQARKTFAPERLSTVLRRAADLLEAAPEAAVDLLLQAQDWDGVSRIALGWAKSLIEQGRHTVLGYWLQRLPPSLFHDKGWLCYWRGSALMPVSPGATIPWCERAFSQFKRDRDRAGLLLSWARIIQSIRFDPRGDVKQMDPWIAVADELLADDPSFPSEEIEYQFVYGMYVALQHRRPWHPRFNAWKDRAIALGLSATDSANRAYLAYLAVSYETQRGHLVQAKLVLDAVSRVKELSALARNFSHLGRIQLQIELGQLDDALATMSAGLEHARAVGIHTWDTFLRWHGGRAALMRGDLALTVRLLAEIADDADITAGVAGCYYNYLAAWTALLQANLPAAAVHAEKAVELAEATGWLISQARSRLLYSRVLQEMGRLPEARTQLAVMLPLAARIDYPAVLSQGLLQEALVAFADDDFANGLRALTRGLKLAHELTFRQSLWFCPADGSRLCSIALEAGIESDFVKEVIRQRRVMPQTPDIENWPWTVKLFTLGRFALLKDDRPIEFSRKAPKKPLALLKALVALGGEAVPENRITDALWPDEDDAHQAYTIAVHRLRRLLGSDEIVQIHEGRVSLNQNDCWVDAWAFQRLLAQADDAARDGKREWQSELVRRALELYRGGLFSEDSDEPWSISARERLRSLFIRHVGSLACDLRDAGRFDEAVGYYLRGIDADPLAEEFYQGLMRCYLDSGRCAEGLAIYRRLRQVLSVTLGIAPSSTSETLHQALLG
jgi:LuxR family transcriptional regulator, maltose regulon positive regulatory protein